MTDTPTGPMAELIERKRPVRVSDRERKCLEALHEAYLENSEFCYCSFKSLMERTGFDRRVVRRSVRALARKGLAEFGRGLWNDDGEVAGSGYCCTAAGDELCSAALKAKESAHDR